MDIVGISGPDVTLKLTRADVSVFAALTAKRKDMDAAVVRITTLGDDEERKLVVWHTDAVVLTMRVFDITHLTQATKIDTAIHGTHFTTARKAMKKAADTVVLDIAGDRVGDEFCFALAGVPIVTDKQVTPAWELAIDATLLDRMMRAVADHATAAVRLMPDAFATAIATIEEATPDAVTLWRLPADDDDRVGVAVARGDWGVVAADRSPA